MISSPPKRGGTSHLLVPKVEALCPTEKVIAGPFSVDHSSRWVRIEERKMAARALRTQKKVHSKARLVMFRGMAFVLRPAEGWVFQGRTGNAETITAKKRGAAA